MLNGCFDGFPPSALLPLLPLDIKDESRGDAGKSLNDRGALERVNRKDVDDEIELRPPRVDAERLTGDVVTHDAWTSVAPSARLGCCDADVFVGTGTTRYVPEDVSSTTTAGFVGRPRTMTGIVVWTLPVTAGFAKLPSSTDDHDNEVLLSSSGLACLRWMTSSLFESFAIAGNDPNVGSGTAASLVGESESWDRSINATSTLISCLSYEHTATRHYTTMSCPIPKLPLADD